MLILAKHTATHIHGKRITEDRNGIQSNIFLTFLFSRLFGCVAWYHFDMHIIIGMQPLILLTKCMIDGYGFTMAKQTGLKHTYM